MESLAEIRRRRLGLGISLGELARAVGRSDATISRIERGQIRPSYDLVRRILEYLEAHEGVAAPHLRAREVMNSQLVTVESSTQLAQAAQLLERGGYSQLPVTEGGRLIGSLSESTVLKALAGPNGRRTRVRDVLEGLFPQVDEDCPADLLATILTRYPAAVVLRRGEPVGIVTKIDLIRGLRGTSLRRAPTSVGSPG